MLKYNLILTFCFLVLFCLSACKDNKQYLKNTNSNYIEQNVSSFDKHLSTTLSSGIVINSDIIFNNIVSINALSSYDAKLVTQDFEKIKKLFLENKTIVQDVTQETNESLTDSPFRYCKTSDNFTLASSGQNIFFKGSLYDKVSSLIDFSESGNSKVFFTGQNLSFGSMKEAQNNIIEILKQLNISVLENPRCYTLDYTTLINESKIYNDLLVDIPDGPLKPKSIVIEKSDECYIFLFQLSANGMPISTHTNGVFGDGSWTSGTSVLCTYSADGLVSLKMDYQFENTSQNGQASKGMDVGQALDKLDQKYNSILLDGEYLVDSIEFEYIPMPDRGKSNSYTLVPAWRFSILHTFEEAQKEDSNKTITAQQRTTSVYHAITGNELLIDFGNA